VRIRLPRRSAGATPRRPDVGTVALALVAYVPLLLTHPTMVGADTKQYLYLDPAKLLSKAPSLWDPSVGLGTVTHQNIGYLFPMGPYYWAAERLGLPDWIAQRIWLGSIIFLAGFGVRRLLRTLAWQGAGITVASFAYALSPYLLHYVYKHSVILLPFVALPWLLDATVRSLRHPGWRDPARFALVALASGGVNATSLLLVLLAPAAWVAHAVWVEKEITLRAAVPPILRIGVLGLATSLWWMAGLALQGSYGINVLRFTETYKTVSDASTPTEVTRSLGYWFFYGIDAVGPWFRAAVTSTQSLPAMVLSFALPTLAVAAALWTRWRYRIFFVVLAVTGVVVSVGAHPWSSPSPYGAVFKAFTATESGLAMRSTPRAVPLVALGVAVFLGAGAAAAAAWRPQRRLLVAGPLLVAVVANLSPLWMGRMLDEFLERPSDVPAYWHEVGRRLDAGDRGTRALEVPGIEFANYRWGETVDPITPGLTDRDYAARELVPYGSDASADLMGAIDLPLQDGTLVPDAYASILRLLGVGDLVLRNDLEYERFRTPRPRPLAAAMAGAAGLGRAEGFGPDTPNVAGPTAPLVDDLELGLPEDLPDPNAVVVHPVEDPLAVVRAVPERRATVVAGDGSGLVALAEAGVAAGDPTVGLDPERLVVYSGTVSDDPAALDRLLDAGAELVVTDTNRKAGLRWGSTKDIWGATELADEVAPEDPSDNRLDLFGGRGTAVQTVAQHRGGLEVTASGYGNDLTFTPGDRAVNAVDGDPATSWRVGAFADVRGEWLRLRAPGTSTVRCDRVRLVQAGGPSNRRITELELRIDGAASGRRVRLDDTSHAAPGQSVTTGATRCNQLELRVVDTDRGELATYRGLSGVGFAEVSLSDVVVTEVIRPPVDLLRAVGERSADHAVRWVFRRQQAARESEAPDPEPVLRRVVDSPVARTATLSGLVRLSPAAPGPILDAAVGRAGDAGRTTDASGHLRNDVGSRAARAFDDDPVTAWRSPLDPAPGAWVQVISSSGPIRATVDSLTLVDDGRHSLPTRAHLEVDGVALPSFDIEVPAGGAGRGRRSTVEIEPQVVDGAWVRLVIDEIRAVTSPDWLTKRPVTLPVGIAELGGLGVAEPADAPLPDGCRDDLVALDGTPVPVRITGPAGAASAGGRVAAERGEALRIEGCGPVELPADGVLLETRSGAGTGIDVDLAVLSSTPTEAAATTAAAPGLAVTRTGPTGYDLAVGPGGSGPWWLVLGQSHNAGWHLHAGDRDLGTSTLVNGFANGWRIDPDEVPAGTELRLVWEPQRTVWFALLASAVGFLVCLVLALRARRPAVRGSTQPVRPTFVPLLDAFGQPAGATATVVLAGVAAVGGAVVVGPWWALPSAAVAAAAARTRWGWWLLRVACVGGLGLAGAYVVAKQWRNAYPLDFDWPQHFDAVGPLTMWAWVLLVVECAVEAVRAGWRRDAELDDDRA